MRDAVVQGTALRLRPVFDVKGLLRALSAREQQYSVEFGDQVISEGQMKIVLRGCEVACAVEIFQRVGRTGRLDAGWVYVSNVEQAFAVGDIRMNDDR